MTPEHRERWGLEIRKQKRPLNKPADLLRRAASSEDFVDSAVIGGVSVADILAGKIAERQIPPDVIKAFHAQYPQHGASFVHAVVALRGDPDKLMGLVSGVKGKLFELDYADWLNHGHLPDGLTAELAHHANNPGWDIVIHDAHGHVDNLLQLKATESLDYVRAAIAAHPDIDVVVPHGLYEKLADHHEALGHILDGHETLEGINGHITGAVHHAEAAGAAAHFPIVGPAIVIGLAVGLNGRAYRQGKVSMEQALRSVGQRGILAVLASGAGWAVTLFAHEPFIGLPTSVMVRLLGGQYFHNQRRRELLTENLKAIRDSRGHLELQLQRSLLEAVACPKSP
ncbi:MAG: hypothetical protein WA252_13575 [Candidatus Sulfotelmatobacter sp.]